MRGTRALGLVLALAGVGCDDDPDPASSAPPDEDAAVADAAPQGCDAPIEVCPDEDGDGRGDPDRVQALCEVPAGYVAVCDDCDDTRRAAKPGAPEQCNAIDDDCDGVADEGLGVGGPCTVGVGACRAAGQQICGMTGQVECDATAGAPGAEACDGVDNDCNGQVDDAAGGCACQDGDTAPCGSDVGACAPGVQRCVDGQLGACEGATGPAEETCNGIDDDCNGQVDDLADPGCGCVDGQPVECVPVPEVFGLGVEVRAPGGGAQASYIQAVSRAMFDGRHLTNDAALEFQSIARLMTMGGHLYIGERTEPTIHKYAVGDDMALDELDTVSFVDSGAPRIDIGQVLISATKAYFLWAGTLTGVVWNPERMEIVDSFDLSMAQREGFEGLMLLQGTFLFEHAVHGNRAFVSTLHSSGADRRYYTRMAVTVFDLDTDQVLKVIEDDRCYGASTMVKADNGDIFVSSYSYSGSIYQAAGYEYKPTCILRIPAGQDEFDPDFIVTFSELTGGRECNRWYPVNGRYSYGVTMPLQDLIDAPSAFSTPGQLYKFDLVERTAVPVEGFPTTSGFVTLGYPDSHDSLVIGVPAVEGQLDRSVVYRLVPADDSMARIFEVDGLFRGFYPVR